MLIRGIVYIGLTRSTVHQPLLPLCKHRVLSFLWLAALRFLCVRTLTCYKLLAAVVVVAAVDVAVVVVVGGGGGGG